MTSDTKLREISKTNSSVDEALLVAGNLEHPIDFEENSETVAANGESLPKPRQRSSSRLAERAATAAVLHANPSVSRTVTQTFENAPMTTVSKHVGLLERIATLESENRVLHGLLTSFQAKTKGCETKIEDLKTALHACSSERNESKYQLKEVLKSLDKVQWENDALKKTQRELELSANQHVRLQKENEELKTHILKQSQPDVVSDAQLNERYESLCADIEDWTETHLGELENVMDSAFAAAENQDWKQEFLQYFDLGLWKMLKPSDPSQLKFLACMIQRLVIHRILSVYAFGVSEEIVEGLIMIEKQMKASERDQDFEHIHVWRADTVRALFDAPDVVESREQKLVMVTRDAWSLLKPLFPKTIDQYKAMTVFHHRITIVAWELSKQLRTSSAKYKFDERYIDGTTSKAKAIYREDMECSILLDSGTGSKLRRSTDVVFDSNGSFGQRLCVIFPALVRSKPDGQDIKIGKSNTARGAEQEATCVRGQQHAKGVDEIARWEGPRKAS